MASKQTYECYVCKRNGHGDVRVYLDGKTDDGKTIYKNIDMSPHVHKPQQQQEKGSSNLLSTVTAEPTSLKVINEKIRPYHYIIHRVTSTTKGATTRTEMTDKSGGKVEKETEEVKTLIKDVERDTAIFLIGILQAIINEQVQTHALHKETGNYIIDAVKDQAVKMMNSRYIVICKVYKRQTYWYV